MFSLVLVSRNSKSLTNILIKFWKTYEVSLWPCPSARQLYCIQRLPSTGNLVSTFPLKLNVPSFTESSQCWPLTPKQTCTFWNVPQCTADITLIAGILCLNTVLQFLQSKWTTPHVLSFSNSVIMMPKLTHVNRHNLIQWTLRIITEHWTPSLRTCQEHYEPYQNFLTVVCFAGSLCSYLMWTRPHLRKKQVLSVNFVQCWSCDNSIFFKYIFHTIRYFPPMVHRVLAHTTGHVGHCWHNFVSFFIRYTKYNPHLRTVWGDKLFVPQIKKNVT
jgi:hypothetical protein